MNFNLLEEVIDSDTLMVVRIGVRTAIVEAAPQDTEL